MCLFSLENENSSNCRRLNVHVQQLFHCNSFLLFATLIALVILFAIRAENETVSGGISCVVFSLANVRNERAQ